LLTAFLTVDISPTVRNVLEGDNQTITCTVSGKPVATNISWTKFSNGGFGTIDRTAVPEKYLGETNENPTLVINNFTTSDTGIYKNQGPTLYFYTLGFPRGGGVSNQSVSKHYTE
jgi:hypothetical protein